MSLVFELPLPPNLANGRMHWHAKANQKAIYYGMLDALTTARQLPKPPAAPIAKPVAEIQMRTLRQMDHDNAHSRLKWCLDWLQTRGYIVNDRDLTYQLSAVKARKADLGITVVLRDAA